MDELVIDDKKYVSSKRAAKMTGYAKDYIGQLCREGRVTARLVGRSWYVLESAIHEHRFGEKDQDTKVSPSSAVFSSTWNEPKYEAAPAPESLPIAEKEPESDESMAERLQDSWKAWFERVGEPAPVEEEASVPLEAPEPKKEEAVSIPIHAIHNEYQPLPHEILAKRGEKSHERKAEEDIIIREYRAESPKRRITLQLTGVLLALIMAGLAVAGSGYFDRYIFTNEPLGSLAGVAFYNR